MTLKKRVSQIFRTRNRPANLFRYKNQNLFRALKTEMTRLAEDEEWEGSRRHENAGPQWAVPVWGTGMSCWCFVHFTVWSGETVWITVAGVCAAAECNDRSVRAGTYSTGAHCLNEWNNQCLVGGRSPCLLDHCGDKGMWLCTPIPVYHIDRIPCDVMLSCGASTCTRNAFRLKLLSRLHVIPLEPAAQTLAHIQIPCRLVMSTGIQ